MQDGGLCFPCNQDDRRHGKRFCLTCGQSVKSYTALLCAGLFRTLSTVANSQPCAPVYSACSQGAAGGGACNHTMQRGPVWHDTTNPCSENQRQTAQAMQHQAASACNARRSMQIRPESRCTGLADSPYIHHVQRIARAARGHFKRFSSILLNASQRSATQSRPPARN